MIRRACSSVFCRALVNRRCLNAKLAAALRFVTSDSSSATNSTDALCERAAKAVREADCFLVSAGAGMGVDSGLPDFRGDEGFWKAYPPLKELGVSFVDMANPTWFSSDPTLAWGFYGHRLNLYRSTQPHAGFGIMLKWIRQRKAPSFVFTSNVDGQFQKAGFHPERILECHGSIHHLQCRRPCTRDLKFADASVAVAVDSATMRADPATMPKCPSGCGSIARPAVLMFGDAGWVAQRTREQSHRFDDWLRQLQQHKAKVCVIEIGAGSAIPTVRFQSESLAFDDSLSGFLIRINKREPQVGSAHRHLSNWLNEDNQLTNDKAVGIALGGLEALRKIDALL